MPRGKYPRKAKGAGEPVTIRVGASDSIEISAKLAHAIGDLRPRLTGFSDAYAALTVRKAELAEPLMDAFSLWNHETGRSFVDFVRAVDPSVPADREGYRVHKVYMACDYLRASVRRRGGAGGQDVRRTRPMRTNAVGRMARLLATILNVIKIDQHEAIWRALADEFAMQPRQISALQRVVKESEPLVKLPIKRQVTAEIVHTSAGTASAEAA